ncbi:DUF1659 domain-containing protein [Aedoeadaptatus urinae]|uniref:DUF1659 domain-containing protein n=1 Tax=Aedoeadaptatus urinae TaxID=1871017 RepID=UPI00097DB17B|nr:DUF1659 domain-containing protein [Peptoniphilus urinae]
MDEKKKSLRIVYNGGTDEAGKTIAKSQTYSGLIAEATDENMNAAAKALAGLCTNPIMYAEVSTVQRLK